jgi:O-antigen/teichoic acid export membrane protein
MKNLLRDSSFVLVSNLVRLFISIASGYITARMLGPDGKGQIALMLQMAALGSNVVALGMGQSYQYYLRKGTYSRDILASHMLIQLALTSLALVLMAFWGMAPLRTITNGQLNDQLLEMSVVLLGLNVFYSFLTFSLMGLPEGVKLSSVYSLIGDGVNIVLLFVLVWVLKTGVIGVVTVNILGLVVKLVPTAILVFRDTRPRWGFPWWSLSKALLVYGVSSMVGQFMYTAVVGIDVFIVNAYLGTNGVGLYSVAVSVAQLVLLLPSAVGVALFPQLTSSSPEEQISTIGKTARISLLFGVAGSIMLFILGYPFIYFVFGTRFLSSYSALLWLLPGIIAMTLNYAYANLFSGSGQPYFNAILYGLATLVNVGANLILIPVFNINGASMSSSIAYCFMTLAFIVLISKQYKINWQVLSLPTRLDFLELISRSKRFLPSRSRL